jgi:hypothetical protein
VENRKMRPSVEKARSFLSKRLPCLLATLTKALNESDRVAVGALVTQFQKPQIEFGSIIRGRDRALYFQPKTWVGNKPLSVVTLKLKTAHTQI